VHHYGDAVDRLDSSSNFADGWRDVESSRAEADGARFALLKHQRLHGCVTAQASSLHLEIVDFGEDLVLGDQGQSGG
jgi:hypothetical protein